MKCKHGHDHQIIGPSDALTRYLVPFELSPATRNFALFLKWAWFVAFVGALVIPFIAYSKVTNRESWTDFAVISAVCFLVCMLCFWKFIRATQRYPKHVGYLSVEAEDVVYRYSARVYKVRDADVYDLKIGRQKLYGINDIEAFNALREKLKMAFFNS